MLQKRLTLRNRRGRSAQKTCSPRPRAPFRCSSVHTPQGHAASARVPCISVTVLFIPHRPRHTQSDDVVPKTRAGRMPTRRHRPTGGNVATPSRVSSVAAVAFTALVVHSPRGLYASSVRPPRNCRRLSSSSASLSSPSGETNRRGRRRR